MTDPIEQAYERSMAAIEEKIERLRKSLQSHRVDFLGPRGLHGKDWGFVGDLGRINRLLAEALNEKD